MLFCDCCLGSADGGVVSFCCIHVEAPTRMGKAGVGSGLARSSQRKWLLKGMALWAMGRKEYICWERRTRASGVVGSICTRAWYSPNQIGIWMAMGPRHPRGLTPAFLYSAMVS